MVSHQSPIVAVNDRSILCAGTSNAGASTKSLQNVIVDRAGMKARNSNNGTWVFGFMEEPAAAYGYKLAANRVP